MENNDNPYIIRKIAINDFFKYATINIEAIQNLVELAENIKKTGLKTKDSLHIASAITADCDYFLSTDGRLLKYHDEKMIIINPINFISLKEELQ